MTATPLQMLVNKYGERPEPVRQAVAWLAERCNLHCVFCFQSDARSPEPTAEEITAHFRWLREQGCQMLIFMRSETLLRRDVPEIISLARREGFEEVFVATNGTPLSSRPLLDRLIDAGLTGLEVSFHAWDEAIVAALTGSRRASTLQRKALDNLAARQRDIGLGINVVLYRPSLDDVPNLLAQLRSHLSTTQGASVKLKFPQLLSRARASIAHYPRYGEVDFDGLLSELDGSNLMAAADNVPACRLGKRATQALGVFDLLLRVEYFEYSGATRRFEFKGRPQGRASFMEPCRNCGLQPLCRGVDSSYLEQFGADEFSPRDLPSLPDVVARLPPDLAALLHRRLEALASGPEPALDYWRNGGRWSDGLAVTQGRERVLISIVGPAFAQRAFVPGRLGSLVYRAPGGAPSRAWRALLEEIGSAFRSVDQASLRDFGDLQRAVETVLRSRPRMSVTSAAELDVR